MDGGGFAAFTAYQCIEEASCVAPFIIRQINTGADRGLPHAIGGKICVHKNSLLYILLMTLYVIFSMSRLHHLASSNDVTTLLQVIYQLFVAPFSKPKNTMGRDYNGQQLTCANKPSCTVHSDDSFQFAAVAHLLQKWAICAPLISDPSCLVF